VFDGHGGREVAIYSKHHLEDTIRENEKFRNNEYSEALRLSFLEIDT